MVYGEGTMTISSNGTVNGTMDLTIFAKNSSDSTLIKKVPLTGKISRPRLAGERIVKTSDSIFAYAIYLVDFSAKTISSTKNKAPIYAAKGVIRLQYSISKYGIESWSHPKVSVFGPNGEFGYLDWNFYPL
jgi:hypothetical protein